MYKSERAITGRIRAAIFQTQAVRTPTDSYCALCYARLAPFGPKAASENFVSERSGWQETIRWCVSSVGRWPGGKSRPVALHHNIRAFWAVRNGGGCDKGARGRASAVFMRTLDVPAVPMAWEWVYPSRSLSPSWGVS